MNKRIKKKKAKQEQEVIGDILFNLLKNEQAFETFSNAVKAVCDSITAYILVLKNRVEEITGYEEPEINPCRGCDDYDGQGGCKSNGGCGAKMDEVTE